MKKICLLLLCSSIAISANAVNTKTTTQGQYQLTTNELSAQYQMSEVKDSKIFGFFRKLLPSTQIDKIFTTPYKNLYIVQAGQNIFYGQLGSPFLMVGHLFNPYTQQDITADVDNLRIANTRVDFSKLDLQNAVITKGKSNPYGKKLVIFEDPDCPYCRILEQQLTNGGLNNKVDIYKILIPLPMHPNAKQHVTNVYCAKNIESNTVLENYMIKSEDNQKIELRDGCSAEKIIEQNAATARAYNVTGTPTVILGNGRLLQGADIGGITDYINANELNTKLESAIKGK
jgi:thiol:disulfide interchange protein DsbC